MKVGLTADDRALVDAWRRGDERAADVLVSRLAPVVGAWLRTHHVPIADRPDCCQETLAAALVALRPATLSGRASLETWVIGVVKNVLRSRARHDFRHPFPQPLDGTRDGPGAPSTQDLDLLLGEALAQLPDSHRRVVELFCVFGLSAEETGRRLGLSPLSVRLYASRARQRVAEIVMNKQQGKNRGRP